MAKAPKAPKIVTGVDLAGNDSANNIVGTDGNDRLRGGGGDDKIHGGGGNDNISGGQGNDHVSGGQGIDHIYGGKGNDIINGGKGFDSVVYNGDMSDYTITLDHQGRVHITDHVANRDGSDIIRNVEEFNFNGVHVAYADLHFM